MKIDAMKRTISDFLNSLTAVLIPMLVLLLGLMIDITVLIYRAFPPMDDVLRIVAAIFLGFALAFPLLLTSVNKNILPAVRLGSLSVGFPEVFAVFTTLMVAFFFEMFERYDQPTSWYLLRGFLSVLFGLIEYLYAHLFIRKYEITSTERSAAVENIHLQHHITLAGSEMAHINDTNEQLHTTIEQQRATIAQLLKLEQQLTCVHCGRVSRRFATHKSHQSKCVSNPRNETTKQA